MFAGHFCRHLRVRIGVLFRPDSLVLPLAPLNYSYANRCRILNRRGPAQLFIFHRPHFDLNIDSIQQRAEIFDT